MKIKPRNLVLLGLSAASASIGIYLIVFGNERVDAMDRTTLWICLDEDEFRDFEVPVREIARRQAANEPVECPGCGSLEISAAVACMACKRHVPIARHGIAPETCLHCGSKMEGGNADLYHPDGAH